MVISRDELESEIDKIKSEIEDTQTGPIITQHIQDLARKVAEEGVEDYVHHSGEFTPTYPRFPHIILEEIVLEKPLDQILPYIQKRLIANNAKPSQIDDFQHRMRTIKTDNQRRIEIRCWITIIKGAS